MLIDVIFLIVMAVCFITDCREQKIYNIVVLPSIFLVIVLNSWFYGFDGFILSVAGFLTGLGILLIPYLLGGMGAGYVKLLAFVGATKGVMFVFNSAIYMALIGGLISLMILIFNRQVMSFFQSLFSWLFSLSYRVKRKIEFSKSGTIKKFPYGTAIIMGALVCLLFKEAWII